MRISINPSSAAFALGSMVMSDTPSGCLRYLLLKRYVAKPEEFPEHLKVMGEAGEAIYMSYLENYQPWPFHRELSFERSLEGVKVRGRMDFITYHNTFKVIHECKTSQSKPFLYGVVRKGEPKINHMAQLVFYLIHLEETRGKLVCLYAPTNELKVFKVEVDAKGEVLVDGRKYIYNVQNQLMHQLMAAEAIKEGTIMGRPRGKACNYCVYKTECDKFDAAGCRNNIESFMEVIDV